MTAVIASTTRTSDPGFPVETLTANYPATVDANDLLLYFSLRNGENASGGTTTPSGLTLIHQQTTGSAAFIANFFKVAAGTEDSGTEVFGITATPDDQRAMAIIARLTGAATVSPINVSALGAEDFAADRVSPSVTTTVDDCLVIYGLYHRGSTFEATPPTQPAGTTLVSAWSNNGSSSPSLALATKTQATAGSTGTGAWTSSSDWSVPFTIAIAPSAGAVPTITDAGDEDYNDAETGISITGTNFGATQGAGKVWISPTDNVNDAQRVEQTVTAWGDTSITFTAVRGILGRGTYYLFVVNNGGSSNASGRAVTFSARQLQYNWPHQILARL